MEFSISDIGNFKIIHNKFKTTKYNVISGVLFKMKKGYKDFSSYVNGINIIVNDILPQLSKFYFVLFMMIVL